MRTAMIVLAAASVVSAQTADFGKSYSFDERKPKTQVERTVDKLMPSIFSPSTVPTKAIGMVNMMMNGCTSDSNCDAMIT